MFRAKSQACICGVFLVAVSVAAQSKSAAISLQEKADHMAWLRNWPASKPLYQQAARLFREAGDTRDATYCEVSAYRGELFHLPLEEYSSRLAHDLTLPLVQQDARLRLRVYALKGDGDLDMDTALAKDDWTHALELAQQLHDAAWQNRASGELGIIALLEGRALEGIQRIGETIGKAEAQSDWSTVARFLTVSGEALAAVRQYGEALPLYDQALAIHDRVPGMYPKLQVYAAKAATLAAVGRSSEAEAIVAQAMPLAQNYRAYGYTADLMFTQAMLDQRKGNSEADIRDLLQARALALFGDVWRAAAEAGHLLAQRFQSRNDYRRASRRAELALEELTKAGDRYNLPVYLADAADIHVHARRYRLARSELARAMRAGDALLLGSATGEQEVDVLTTMSHVYEKDFELEAYEFHSVSGAFSALEQARGRAIRDLLAKADRNSKPAEEQQIVGLQVALLRSQSPGEQQQLLEKLAWIQVRGWGDIRPDRMRITVASRPCTIPELQSALRPDEALIEYAAYARPTALVITKTTSQLVALSKLGNLSQNADGVQNAASRRTLYNQLIAPVMQIVSPKDHWIIVPDASLTAVPFDAMEDSQGQLLLKHVTINYVPSATLLIALRTTRRPTLRHRVLAVGVSHGTSSGGPAWSAVEARSVAATLGAPSTVLVDQDATLDAWEKARPEDFAALHFATHGFVDEHFPNHSGLLLAKQSALLAAEVVHIHLNATLVNLAACETDRGFLVPGEGNNSLADAFLAAGARSVLATTAKVDDSFTLAIMREFYSRLARGVEVGDALRQAKLAMIASYGAGASPEKWGAFLLLGDGRSKLP
jgi:CHAT domain-containing protein/tetratricopeptide (TPR) repeat protein